MHIIWITPQFPNGKNNRNGMFIYRTVQELGKHYKITVLALYPVIPPIIPMLKNLKDWKKIFSDWKTSFPRKPEIPDGTRNISVHYVKYIRTPRNNYLDIEGWFAYLPLKKYFENINKTDKSIIHASWIFPSGQAARLLSKKYELPFIVTLRGSDVNFIKPNTARYESAVKIIRKANKVTSVSQVLIDELIKKGILKNDSNTSLTHSIYDFLKFNIKDKNVTKIELGMDTDKKIIFFAGTLRKLKNLDLLIKSVAILVKEKYNLNLIIAGAGYEEENLRKLVEKENLDGFVKFLGNINEDLLVKNYNAADVFCLPSSNEGLPNVIIESLLCGTPIVATRVGEIPHIVQTNINGYLVESNSINSLTDGIKKTLNKNWDRCFLRDSVSFLSESNVLGEYKNVYNEVEKNKNEYSNGSSLRNIVEKTL